jgi:hypothetical protein
LEGYELEDGGLDFWGVDIDCADCGDARGVFDGFCYPCSSVEWMKSRGGGAMIHQIYDEINWEGF